MSLMEVHVVDLSVLSAEIRGSIPACKVRQRR
jgi:hypothetical protein